MISKEKKPVKKVAIVYMVAGLSSRFGGKIKQFAQVRKKGETLIEVSMQQAIKAGFKEIIVPKSNVGDIVVSKEELAKVKIIPVSTLVEVLQVALVDSPQKTQFLKDLTKAVYSDKLSLILPKKFLPKPILVKTK